MKATLNHPPNTLSFDPKMQARSFFQTPKATAGAGSGKGILQMISSILSDVQAVVGHCLNPATQSNMTSVTHLSLSLVTVASGSPPKNTPTKLPHFLLYAEEKEGIQNATIFKLSLSEKGFGLNVIMMDDIDKNDLIACRFNTGDALCLKHAAHTWWTSPDAKCTWQRSPTPDRPLHTNDHDYIQFEKRYVNGRSVSVFGPGIISGKNHHTWSFEWCFFNSSSNALEKVPDGFIPNIDPEYLDLEPLFTPTPTPEELTGSTD